MAFALWHSRQARPDAALSPEADSSQFVVLTDAVPDAILEIRYFGTYNFVGTRIDGYEEPVALLTRVAADSLQASLRLLRQGHQVRAHAYEVSQFRRHQARAHAYEVNQG